MRSTDSWSWRKSLHPWPDYQQANAPSGISGMLFCFKSLTALLFLSYNQSFKNCSEVSDSILSIPIKSHDACFWDLYTNGFMCIFSFVRTIFLCLWTCMVFFIGLWRACFYLICNITDQKCCQTRVNNNCVLCNLLHPVSKWNVPCMLKF